MKDCLVIFVGVKLFLVKFNVVVIREKLENGNWFIVGVWVGIYGIEEEIFSFLGIEFKCICMIIFGDFLILLYFFEIMDVLIVLLEWLIMVVGYINGVCIVDFDFFEVCRDIVFWMCKID